MANEEHLKWLNEGVVAWNRRRRDSLFKPDLSGADRLNAALGGADLTGANLKQANLTGANLTGTSLTVADVRTIYSATGKNDESTAVYTKIAKVRGLSQSQLDSMTGDSGTIIPDNLTRPKHWEVLPWHQEDNISDTAVIQPDTAANPPEYYQQLALNLTREPIASSAVFEAYGKQLLCATRMYRQATQVNDIPGDLILVEQIAETLTQISAVIRQDTTELENRIRELENQIKRLNETIKIQAMAINNGDNGLKTALIAAAAAAVFAPIGAAAGTTILESATNIFGQSSELVQGFTDTISKYFTAPTPQIPNGKFTDT